jgi:hypothetical protein
MFNSLSAKLAIQYPEKHTKLIANQFNRSKVIDCVEDLLTLGSGTPGTQRDITFSQLAVKGLINIVQNIIKDKTTRQILKCCDVVKYFF